MNYIEIEKASVSNGTGFRVVLWVSGCTLHCPYCQNPESWDFNAGKEFTEATKEKMFEALNAEWVQGITFSGGHPLEPHNINDVYQLILEIRDRLPEKDVWLYTGYDLTIDQFFGTSLLARTLSECDVVVDGRYIDDLRDITLPFRGSSNQRLINVQKTLLNKRITQITEEI